MSFLNKLGIGKKHDDFDLPPEPDSTGQTYGAQPSYGQSDMNNQFGSSTPPNNQFGQNNAMGSQSSFDMPGQQNSFDGSQQFGGQPNMGTVDQPASFVQQPQASTSFDPTNPFTRQQEQSNSPGARMAREYYQAPQQDLPQTDDKMELIQVKLDAIRSELGSIAQRLQHVEQRLGEKKRGW